MLIKLLKTLLNLTKELRRIREILEIVFKDKLTYHRLSQDEISYPTLHGNEAEFTVTPYIQRDIFGEVIDKEKEEDEREEQEQKQRN